MRANHFTMQARQAIKASLRDVPQGSPIGVGCSGGADSLALLCGLATLYKGKDKAGLVHVVIVDHQLQEVTAEIAATTAKIAESFGFTVHVVPVNITSTGQGAESDARKARYEAFESVIAEHNLASFLIGHTKTDQAEQVFLGMLRGSGTRSLSGIPKSRGVFQRPFLDSLSREDTQTVCQENNVQYWNDPHNESMEYKRVCVRKLIAHTQEVTGQSIVDPLVRTARISAEDADALTFYADQAYSQFQDSDEWDVAALRAFPSAIRKRLYRKKLAELGAVSDTLSFEITNRVDALVANWSGQGEICVSNDIKVARISGEIVFTG